MTTVNTAPATKADLIELEERLDAKFDKKLDKLEAKLDAKFDDKLDKLEAKLDAKLDSKLANHPTKADLEAWGLRLLDMLGGMVRASNDEMRDWMRAHAEETRTRDDKLCDEFEAHRDDTSR